MRATQCSGYRRRARFPTLAYFGKKPPQKKLNPGARIVWVSSGGLYLKKLDLDSLFNNINYEKVSTYANVKRAQVTLVEELANIENIEEFNHYSMHPGWVDTSGLSSSLPQFFHLMKHKY